MNSATSVKKFLELLHQGKNAALDANNETGEVVCIFTKNIQTEAEGNGTPAEKMSRNWERIALCKDFEIIKNK